MDMSVFLPVAIIAGFVFIIGLYIFIKEIRYLEGIFVWDIDD
jgi:hypothetical protein